MNRRELLKWFGAGAAIVPIIDGMPKPEAEALIVKPPEVALAPPAQVFTPPEGFYSRGEFDVEVFIRDRSTRRTYRFGSPGWMEYWNIEMHSTPVDVTMPEDVFRRFLPGPVVDTSIRLRGRPELVTR